VLEAAASGLPLIVTGGGSTDDFVTDAFARKIRSSIETVRYDDVLGRQLNPDLDHLIALMEGAADDESWRHTAGAEASRHSHTHFNWDRIVQQFLEAARP
jgi:glycosyltransferase involved in cell wall biosynthesis